MPPDFLVFAFRRLSKVRGIASRGGGKRKRESLRSSPSVDADLAAKETRYIPTPPRAMTNLFDATCTRAGHLEKTGESARGPYPFR